MLVARRARLARLVPIVALAALVVGVGVISLAAAPARAGGKGIPQVTVVVRDGRVEAPQGVPTGFVAFTYENRGTAPFFGALVRLQAGVTPAGFGQAVASEGFEAFERLVAAALSGPAFLAPGTSQTFVVEIRAGTHLLMDFSAEEEEGPPAIGAVIQGTPPPAATEPPEARGTIVASEFFFQVPAIPAGTSTFAFTNAGRQVHHMLVFRLAPGVTLAEALAAEEQGMDPFEAGLVTPGNGALELTPGETVYPTLSFTPGTYAMVCFIEDPATGQPHAELGMVREFTVR